MGGCGFQYRFPSLLPIDFPEHESVLLWTLASKDSEQVYTFAAGDDEAGAAAVSAAKATLQKYFKVVAESDEPAKFVFRFAPEEPALKKDSLGNVPFVMRNRVLLRTLVRGEYVSFEERSLVHDQWTKMLMYFGVPLRYEGRGMEQLSEFERRLMMAQGKKIERTQMTELSEARVITGRDYYVPGDATEAMAFALLTTIGKVPKGNVVKLLNVDLNSTRAGALRGNLPDGSGQAPAGETLWRRCHRDIAFGICLPRCGGMLCRGRDDPPHSEGSSCRDACRE